MKSKFKFQVFPSHQDRKTDWSVHFLGEVMAQHNFRLLCLETISDTVHAPLYAGACIFFTPFSLRLYIKAVSITDNLCTKQGNSSIF